MNEHAQTARRRDAATTIAGALTPAEQRELVAKVPAPQRTLFAAWLRGERTLDGDPIASHSDIVWDETPEQEPTYG